MPRHPKTTSIKSFKGLNNVLSPESTTKDYLKKALNINIDKQGHISKRKGYSEIDTGDYTSLWANKLGTLCYAVKDGNLIQILENDTNVLLQSNIGADILFFEEIDGIIYFSSDTFNGIIENDSVRTWGIEIPPLPILGITSGLLEEGVYQIAFTYVDDFGRSSGSRHASLLSVSSGSGIQVTIPLSEDSRVTKANIYASTPNGTTLYFNQTVTPGTTATVSVTSNTSNPLRSFNLYNAPLGSIIRYFRGRIYVAYKNILWYSEPNQYEYFKLESNYIEFPDNIKEVMPVEDGIWIGSDSIYYLSGSNPDNFKLTLKERVEVVSGTSKRFSGSYILLENTPIGYKWLVTTNLGIFVMFNQGVIINLTATNLSLERGDTGTSVFLQDEGMNQYLSIIKKNYKPDNSVVGDIVTTSVIRNGINIG